VLDGGSGDEKASRLWQRMRYRIPSTQAPAPRSAILLSEILIRRFASRVPPGHSASSACRLLHGCAVSGVWQVDLSSVEMWLARTCIGPLLVLCLVVTSRK
jgi:hypothetical protein